MKDLNKTGNDAVKQDKKFTLKIDGREYEWEKPVINGHELRGLAGISENEDIILLQEDADEDLVIQDATTLDAADAGIQNLQVVKKGEGILVTIRINDNPYPVKRGPIKVAELKKLARVPLADQMSQLVKGKLKELQDQGTVAIKGGEEFFSYKREGCSS